MSKTKLFKTKAGGKSKENSPPHRNLPKHDSSHGNATADRLVLDMILPTNNRITLNLDPFSTFADLNRAIEPLLTLRGSNRVTLSRRVSRMKGWENIDIADHETLIGKLSNHGTYRVNVVENSSCTADASITYSPRLEEHPSEHLIGLAFEAYQSPDTSFEDTYAVLPRPRVVREHQDEEFAMRLQTNECLVHHEKIELDKSCIGKPRSITPPLSLGEVVLRGTLSQYTAGGGESACTSIALVAAKHFLVNCKGHADPLEYTDSTVLDAIIERGIGKYGMTAPGHSNLDDIWTLPVFEDTVESLEDGQRVEDRVGFEGFNRAIEQAWASTGNEELKSKAVAVIITKPPVTLLCFSCTGDVWYLLDSHGENYAINKVAYFMRFESTMNLALELEGKFPTLPGDSHDLGLAMYNSFEATPILAAVSGNESIVVAPTTTASINEKSISSPSRTQSFSLDLDMFHCQYTQVVMADPVVGDDGHTYDRSSIEKHFQIRREEEQKRLRELLSETNEADDASSSCGGPRPPIELTSPMTGVVISDRLVPNHFVENQIVALVESNALEMTEAELADWRQRRAEKKEKDRQRVEQDRRVLEEQERMRKNRQEAEQLRAEEAASGSPTDSSSENASMLASQMVRVDRCRGERLGSDDLGISTALCDQTSWVEIDYACSQSEKSNIRCMSPCCARLLSADRVSWCCRCGRISCMTCLGFQVTDVSRADEELHRICGECVMQVLDMMPRDGVLGQRRAYLMKLRLQPYLSELSTRAIDAQDILVRQSTEVSFAADIRNVSHDIQELQNTRETLQGQLEAAESRANEAMLDDGATGTRDAEVSDEDEEVIQWEEAVSDLQRQYDELMRKTLDRDMDEDAQILHFQAVSDISYRLEEAQSSLAEIRSRSTAGHRASDSRELKCEPDGASVGASDGLPILPPETNADMCVADLQCTCETLQRLHDRLQAQAIPGDAEAFLSRTQAISTVLSRFDQAQAHLIEARNRLDTGFSLPNLEHLANLINQFVNQARSVNSSCARPTAPKKRRGFRRLFSSAVDDAEATTLSVDQIVSERVSALFYAGQNCLQATNSPESRLDCIKEALNELSQLSDHVASMNGEARSLHRNAVQHARSLHKEITRMIEGQRDEKQQIREAYNRVSRGEKSISKMNLEELQNEFLQLSNALEGMTDPDEITVAMMRLTEIEQALPDFKSTLRLPEIHKAPLDIEATCVQEDSASGEDCVVTDTGFLSAIGKVDEDWPLPLGLKYPTTCMQNEIELLRNTLADRMIQSERKYDSEFSEKLNRLTTEKEELEDEVQDLRSKVENAEASAEAEQDRLEQRRERHRQEEAKRREREKQRLEKERRLRREREELESKNAADEAKTMEALRNAVGREGNAQAFGGQGDLRMCRICKAGPVENRFCSDLDAHNDTSNMYKGSTVARVVNPNQCKNCGNFDSSWHDWLIWDGVYGPH